MTQTRSEETRSTLLQVARRCFAEHGYDATGVAGICAGAGISKGAFYYHFESKQAIFLAILTDWLDTLERALIPIAATALPVPDLFVLLMHGAKDAIQSHAEWTPLILEFWTQSSRDVTVQQASLATYRHYHQFMVGLIQRGIAEGSFASMDAEAGAQVVLSLASGLLFQGLLDPHSADWERVAENSIQILLNGLRRRSE
ncbi:MAG: TetR/AcrR family transcriptional regulator [Anaerolineae bacterium]|nr:TetR/AcrR family transcriptional regulator [Anaerolineae bacterium]